MIAEKAVADSSIMTPPLLPHAPGGWVDAGAINNRGQTNQASAWASLSQAMISAA